MNARRTSLMIVAIVVLTGVVIVAAMTMLQGDSEDPRAAGETAATEEATAPASEATAQVVDERPDCPATSVGGITLPCLGGENGPEQADQGVVIANVWAWWCGPCRDELPHLEEYAETHPAHRVVGVHADQNAANGAAFLNDVGVELPSYQDSDNTFAGTLGLPGVVPITVLFLDGEQVAMFPKTFSSPEEIAADVDAALAEVT